MSELTAETLFAKAESKLESAEACLSRGFFDDAVSRSFLAVYHAFAAALLTIGKKVPDGSEPARLFQTELIEKGVFPDQYGAVYERLAEEAHTGDFSPFAEITAEQAAESCQMAEEIVATIRDKMHTVK